MAKQSDPRKEAVGARFYSLQLIIDVRENRVKIGDKRQMEHRSFEIPKLKPNPSTIIQSYWKPKNSL